MGLTATTTNLSYARNELIKVGISFTFDKVADMIYYMLANNDIAQTFSNAATPITIETAVTGIDFTGTYSGNAIDFSDTTQVPTGSNGPCLIRAGTYATPITNTSTDQSGLIRFYMSTSAAGTSYDRGVFVCLKTTGVKGIFPVAGLAEVLEQTGVGPTKAQAAQFIAGLHTDTSKLATIGADTTAGMYGAWLKVYSVTGSEASSGSRVASVWLDNQMCGTVSGEEYTIFSTTGGTRPNAWAAFETTSSGWDNFLYFDETAYDQAPVGTTRGTPNQTATCDSSLKVLINDKTLYIPLYNAVTVSQ